jgi:hypothetical protein
MVEPNPTRFIRSLSWCRYSRPEPTFGGAMARSRATNKEKAPSPGLRLCSSRELRLILARLALILLLTGLFLILAALAFTLLLLALLLLALLLLALLLFTFLRRRIRVVRIRACVHSALLST